MKSDINDLCEAFLAALTNAGYAVKSIENYKQVSNRFKKFCAENGYDTYTVNIGQIFADNVFNEETGAFVGYRNVMYGRFVRLINSFYLQGTFDFSMVTKEKNLPKSIHLIEIYQDYMEHLKTQYSNIGTIGFFQNGMLHLLRYMEDGGILTLKDLAVSDVVNYICSWSQKHQRNVLCILRNIFQHFGREDLYFAVAGIHPYRTKRIVPMFTDNEIMSIEEVLSSPSVSHRDAAIFFLGLTTGMRAVDVVDLRLANIDWDNETIFFQQSKTGNAVCLPLTVDIGNSIYRYILEERPRVDDDHVFLRSQAPFIPLGGHSTCYYIVSNILQRAGIQKDGRIWGMCMLRHNAASMMVQNSIPLTTIAAILGHAETRTTDIYIASNSRRRASASACARASSSCFKRASAAALRAFFSLENPTRARTTATATPEANSPIPSGRKVKEHKRNSVAATKRAIEDFFILIPLSNCKFLRQNSPILTFNTIIRPPCAKIKNKAEYSHTLCK